MKAIRHIATSFGAPLCLLFPGMAQACSDPSERWYVKVSDVVFDAVANCNPDQRSCQLRVTSIMKNPQNLAIDRRRIEVDYQNWYADWFASNPDEIIIICGVPVFEPTETRFRARFYANLDKKTSELIVRKAEVGRPTEQGAVMRDGFEAE
ncbi:MAG: hypothetical protein JNL35_02030 [Sphingopyxis sp.]|nr:hypothetical protein [Sphingopyxis sp.]